MRNLCVLLVAASVLLAADWGSVERIEGDRKVQVKLRNGKTTTARFVAVRGDALVLRERTGERAIARAEVKRVRVSDPSRRVRNGLIGVAVGVGVGAAVGVAICPSCPNEGHGTQYVGPGIAAGAGLGALALLPGGYRTVYEVK